MPRHLPPVCRLALCLLCLHASTTRAQDQEIFSRHIRLKEFLSDTSSAYPIPKHRLNQQVFYFEWDWLMNPIYATQITSVYKLNANI